jgi:alpha-beta hydrolase superfamily lysophospholipase
MTETSKPLILIVPGSFHGPVHYEKVAELLRERGYEVITPALVTTGAGDLDPTLDHIDDQHVIHKALLPLLDQGKKAVVVSHSYGSLPAATAVEGQTTAERSARGLKGGIEAIVTITSFVFPTRGKSIE